MSTDRSSSPSMSQENIPPRITITSNFHTTQLPGSYPNTWPYTIGFTGDNFNVQIHHHPPTYESRLTPQPPSQRPAKRAASSENIASKTSGPNKRHASVGSTPTAEARVLQPQSVIQDNNRPDIYHPSMIAKGMKVIPADKTYQNPPSATDSEDEENAPDNTELLACMAMLKNQRPALAAPTPEEIALQAKILALQAKIQSRAKHVEDFSVFQSAEDHAKDLALANRDVKPSKTDIDMLLESIPLEDRAGETNLTETVLVTLP